MAGDFSGSIGRRHTAADRIDPARSHALRAALGQEGEGAHGEIMPLLHHWLHFWDVRPPEALGPDGHPAKGGFLPPVPLPRRMWAGGGLEFHRPLHFGERVERVSTILDVAQKSGRSGTLVFVTLEHRLSGEGGLAIVERQDLVYREASTAAARLATDDGSPPQARWCETVQPDPVLLFRYSALTMNAHRIHYDRPYATGEEGYPALVVHGPLQATLLADLAQRALGRELKSFAFRGRSPAFDGIALHVCANPEGGGASLWTQQAGAPCMTATAR